MTSSPRPAPIHVFVRVNNKLARFEVADAPHEEAITLVTNYLHQHGHKPQSPVPALIQGGRA